MCQGLNCVINYIVDWTNEKVNRFFYRVDINEEMAIVLCYTAIVCSAN